MRAPYLVCGVPGSSLAIGERRLLRALQPAGIILFTRNVEGADQVAGLVSEIRALEWQPYVAVDLEGGRVNRLRTILGELPSPARAAAAGAAAARALGEAIGGACAALGIGAVFAPVVDVARDDGFVQLEGRCLGDEAARVVAMARACMAGIEGYGVAPCLKHFPGLGSGRVDSHEQLPVLDDGAAEERGVFLELASPGRAVMVAHALAPSLGEAWRPASLSETVIAPLRGAGTGPIIADDLEMGALGSYGSIPERAAAALLAGCEQVPVCNAMDAREAVVEHVESWAGRSPALREALSGARAQCGDYGLGPLRDVTWDEAVRLAARALDLCGHPE